MREVGILLLGLGLLVVPGASHGSDHADPINLKVLEAGLTDLFAFPDGDQLVVVLATRRALTAAPPYQLEPYEYAIYMDLHSRLTFDNAQHRARYGGTVEAPEGSAPTSPSRSGSTTMPPCARSRSSASGTRTRSGCSPACATIRSSSRSSSSGTPS